MMVWAARAAAVLAIVMACRANLTGQRCTGGATQQWLLAADGTVKSASAGTCLTAASGTAKGGIELSLAPCTGSNPLQQWTLEPSLDFLVLKTAPTICANLENYGTQPGSTVWGFNPCNPGDCKGNCDWEMVKGAGGATALQNKHSGLCLDSTPAPVPPPPPPPMPSMRTCAVGSPAAALPFCDVSKSMEERAAALVANLTMAEKLSTFMLVGQLRGIPRLNIKKFRWDATDIEGVDDQVFKFNNTCYPHAIGIGATWDRELITEIGQVTAVEARVLEQKYWALYNGTYIGAVNFDGGPLANVAYDPRVGRTSEMYGECPYHAGQVGMLSTLALQNKTTPESNGDFFLQTSQVTRHFITDHGSWPDNGAGNYFGSLASLEDEFLPPFKAFQVDGEAEGIMFSISALNGMADTANTYLFNKLRTEWKTTCIAQTDCCGTFHSAVSAHRNFNTTEDAVAAAMNAGIQLDYGDNVAADITNAIAAGKLSQSVLDAAVTRTFLTRFRLGEFDEERNPFFMKYDDALLDCDAHRQHARKAVGASIVLLQNNEDVLPLKPTLKKVAVIGPWSDCKDRAGGYGGSQGYLNNYKGQPSYISTILDAVQEMGNASGFEVVYAQGSPFTGDSGNATMIVEAVAAAKGADVVLLALGLGNDVEGEGRDRTYLTFPGAQQDLVSAIQKAKGSSKLVLAINSAGGVDLAPSGFDAIVQLWYGGQETGHGLADVLWGRVNPSGRLPLTVHTTSYLSSGVGPIPNLNMTFSNGSIVQGRTYRYLASQEADAVFSFGWGLTYSQFKYSALSATPTLITVTVTNVGKVPGAEVAQLYLGLDATGSSFPAVKHALAGFEKVALGPGASQSVTFPLRAEQLTVVNDKGTRIAATGTVAVAVAGHLPSDPRAALPSNANHVSNVVEGSFDM